MFKPLCARPVPFASRLALLALGTALSAPLAAQTQEDDLQALRQRVERLERQLQDALERLETDRQDREREKVELVEQSKRLEEARSEVERVTGELEGVSQFFDRQREPGFSIGDTQVTYGGYIKLDTMVSVFSDGAPPSSSPGRDFYIPATLPVSNSANEQTVFDFSPRETRFLFKTATPLGDHELTSHIEFDFLVTFNDNEVVSNSFTPRMRQAFLTYRGFLLGQAWTVFQNVTALPELLDFVGPSEGTVFARQAQIRYTRGPFEVAAENPETLVTAPGGGRIVSDSDIVPDFTARYTYETALGDIKLAGLFRQLRLTNSSFLTGTQTAYGFGGSLSGRLRIGDRGDNVRFMANVGEGIGRYIGIALVDDATIDADGDLDPVFLYSGFASYQHFWSKRWRSTFAAGYFRADNPVQQAGFGVTDQVFSFHGNILYSPVNRLTVGLEYIFAQRRIESGATGELNRFQFSARYGF